MLLNRDRAEDILQREGLDGLIAGSPRNSYYLSDYWGLFNTPGGYDAAYFAVLPAAGRPAALVMPALELRRLESKGGTWMDTVLIYSSPDDAARFDDGTAKGIPYTGWAARPGVRYSELATAVGDAVRREGIPNFRDPVVHSLGLEHTDDPKPPGVQPQTKPDQRLQPGMVVNVDMPHTEIGWGSVHMEDTVQITADGCARLGTADFSLRVVD